MTIRSAEVSLPVMGRIEKTLALSWAWDGSTAFASAGEARLAKDSRSGSVGAPQDDPVWDLIDGIKAGLRDTMIPWDGAALASRAAWLAGQAGEDPAGREHLAGGNLADLSEMLAYEAVRVQRAGGCASAPAVTVSAAFGQVVSAAEALLAERNHDDAR